MWNHFERNQDIDYGHPTYARKGAHRFYLGDRLLPQTPAKITVEYPDNTETIRIASDTNLTIPHHDSPIKISFDFELTTRNYPWTWDVSEHFIWTDKLWEWKQKKEPINFLMVREEAFDIAMKVLLTDWSFVEDAENESDITVSVTLIEYFPQTNVEINTDIEHHLIKNRNNRGWMSGRGM